MKVKEIMGAPIVISKDISVKDASKKMAELNITTMMIIEGKKLIGIVTEGDIVERFATTDKISKEVSVGEIMSSHLIKTEEDESVEYAVGIMLKNKIRRLPVVSKGRLVGMLTLDYLAKHLPEIGVDSWL